MACTPYLHTWQDLVTEPQLKPGGTGECRLTVVPKKEGDTDTGSTRERPSETSLPRLPMSTKCQMQMIFQHNAWPRRHVALFFFSFLYWLFP